MRLPILARIVASRPWPLQICSTKEANSNDPAQCLQMSADKVQTGSIRQMRLRNNERPTRTINGPKISFFQSSRDLSQKSPTGGTWVQIIRLDNCIEYVVFQGVTGKRAASTSAGP
jgi:hypothetical protein